MSRVAVVTGGASGIGSGICPRLAKAAVAGHSTGQVIGVNGGVVL